MADGNLFGGLLGAFGAYDQYKGIGDIQDQYNKTISEMSSTLPSQVEFKPYTVTSGLGTTATDASGGATSTLSDTQQGYSDLAFQNYSNFMGLAGQQNPMLQQQANMFGNMFGGYSPSAFNAQQLGSYQPQDLGGLGPYGFDQFNYQAMASGLPNVNTNLGPSGAARITDTVSPYGFGNAQLGQMSNQLLGANNLMNAGQAGAQMGAQGAGMTQMGMGMLGNVGPNAQISGLSSAAMGLGQQGLAQAGQAPSDLQALRGTTASQAQGMLGGLGQSTAGREQEIYNRIRAAQTPEEQRQALALEERLAAQGRLGISTAQYGGTPEQLAMAKAQEEAKNSAMMTAMQQAGSEADRAYQQATGMAGLTGSLAGQSSALQSQAQQRATELSNLGMSAAQINSQLQSEGLSRGLQTTQAGIGMQQAGSQLSTEAQNRAAQLAQMGMSAAQINSQLQSEGLGRSLQAGEYNRQGTMLSDQLAQSDFQRRLGAGEFGLRGQELADRLATSQTQRDLSTAGFNRETMGFNSQLQNEALQRALQSGQYGREGLSLASQLATQALGRDVTAGGFMNQQDQLAQQMRTQDIQNQLALAGGSQGALAQMLGLQQGYGQLGQGMMQMGYSPYDQLRQDFRMGDLGAQLAASGRETGAGLLAQLGLGNLAEQTKLEQIRGDIFRQGIQSAGGMFSGSGGGSGGINIDIGSALGSLGSYLGDLFGFGDNAAANVTIDPVTGLPVGSLPQYGQDS